MLKKHYRLGIDMGSSSIGWAMLLLNESNEPCGIERMGVRIFPDGREAKTPTPLSVSRREARGARRNHDRFLQRMRNLLKVLDAYDFLPKDVHARKQIFSRDPYQLRAKALDAQISKAELARALFHLAKRRGFQSNRKTDGGDSSSDFKAAIENLDQRLQQSGARSIGEYLFKKQLETCDERKKPSLRFRYDAKSAQDTELIFPRRDMVIEEFELIWENQMKYHAELCPSLKEEVYHAIFYQRPLKPTIKGKCQLEPAEDRAPKAHPLFQEFRILQDVNNLELEDVLENAYRPLLQDERNKVTEILMNCESSKLSAIRTKLFKKDKDNFKFNLETENRDKLLGDLTAHRFRKKKDSLIPDYWNSQNKETQYTLVELLCSDAEEDVLRAKLSELCGSAELAEELFYLSLPSDYANLSIKALSNIVPYMREGLKYSEACTKAGYDHSGFYNGTVYHEADLPYYGELLTRSVLPLGRKSGDADADEFGKINNPTVHIALNQIRKIINALEKVYGPPAQIVLELARELKMSSVEREKIEKKQRSQTKTNERIAAALEDLAVTNNYENRTRFKLWEELSPDPLERRCIYSGRSIPIEKLFSAEFEIEHILPKSRTFDDSISNKTISYYAANRYKGERSPFDAFGASRDSYEWDAIVQRASKLPENKRRRFLKDAMERYADEAEVLGRMLNDTRYMSRIAKEYLQYVVGDRKIWVVNGQQTAKFRSKWGLNKILSVDDSDSKNREDHRHHAIDAFVIAMMSRSTINRYSTAVKQSRERFLEKIGDPFPEFNHEEFAGKVRSIVTSYKPDQINIGKLRRRNQTAGSLLKETAYGYIGPDPKNPKYHIYTERKQISGLSKKDVERIIDPVIQQELNKLIGAKMNDKDFAELAAHWAKQQGMKKLKLRMTANPATMIGIADKTGRVYKYYASGENLFMDVYCTKPWDADAPWATEIVNSFAAHGEDFQPKWKQEYPMARLIMRLFKNDVVCLDTQSGREFRRVKKMSPGRLYLRDINIAKRAKEEEDSGECFSISGLRRLNARKAGIDVIGRAFDPYQEGTNASTGDKSQ